LNFNMKVIKSYPLYSFVMPKQQTLRPP